MAVIQVVFLISTILMFSYGFYLPPNDGTEIGEHFLNQKLTFLEGKFKNSPLVDFDLIKQKIEAKKLAEKEENGENEEKNPEIQEQKLWFLQNKFSGPKFDFIKQKIESKQTEKSDLDIFNQKVTFLENLLNQHFNKEQPNHEISKRSTKDETTPDFGAAIGNYFLNQKLSFLESKFKDSPLVDFDLIKQKIEAKQAAKEQEPEQEPEAVQEDKFTNLLNFLKQLHAQKLVEDHQIAKRSVDETTVKDPSIGKYFLNQKLSFLENKFKDSPLVDFDLIKQKIEAKQAAKEPEQEPEAVQEDKFTNLLNFLKQLHAQKLVEDHQIAKRSVDETNVKDPSIGNYFLNQKLSFMENKFKGTPIDFETIKNKIEAKKEAKLQEEEELENNDEINVNLQEKITFLQNFLKQMKADQLKAIIDKIEGSHNVAKRSVKNENENGGAAYGAAMKDHFLSQKYAFLSNKFKQINMDSDALLQKIQSKQTGGQ